MLQRQESLLASSWDLYTSRLRQQLFRQDSIGIDGLTSSPTPRARPSLPLLDEAVFDAQHHSGKRQRVGHDGRGVEELKIEVDLEADAVGAAEELDH